MCDDDTFIARARNRASVTGSIETIFAAGES